MRQALLGADSGRTVHPRPRRRTALGAPLMVVLTFAVAAPFTELLAALGAGRDPAVALVLLSAAALLLGWFARPVASIVVGPVCWLFLDGFVVHRTGSLGWQGGPDALRLAVLVGAGLAGGLLGVLAPGVRAGAARLRAVVLGRFGRASLEPFDPVAPPAGHPWYWN